MSLRETPGTLHYAAYYGDIEELTELLTVTFTYELEIKDNLGQTALMVSVLWDNFECTSTLLKAGACIDACDLDGQTALHIAVNLDSYNCVKVLLDHDANWQQKNGDGITALHLACALDSTQCLSAILSLLKPEEIDTLDANNRTTLHWSSAYGRVEAVQLLLNKGANVLVPDEEGKTSVHWAAICDKPTGFSCLKLLIENTPSAINWRDYKGCSALHFAVLNGSINSVDFLSSKENCNIHISDHRFLTPLHWAATEGFLDAIALLLDRGADCTIADIYGATPIHYAAYNNQAEAMELYLSQTNLSNLPDSLGCTALIWAAIRNSDAVIKVLAQHNIDFSFCIRNELSAVYAATTLQNESTVELLVNYGAPVNTVNRNHLTPLLRACQVGNSKIVQTLLKNGASVSPVDKNEKTCLHWAAEGGHAYMCEKLLAHEAKVNARDCFGKTPLHYAVCSNDVNCVNLLLEYKANPNVSDKEGKTPLHLAVLNDTFDILKLLCQYGAYVNTMAPLEKWSTPLDCALWYRYDQISKYLQETGGMTSLEIKNFAAKRIQIWYRKISNAKKKHICSFTICPHESEDTCKDAFSATNFMERLEAHFCQLCNRDCSRQLPTFKKSLSLPESWTIKDETSFMNNNLVLSLNKIPIASDLKRLQRVSAKTLLNTSPDATKANNHTSLNIKHFYPKFVNELNSVQTHREELAALTIQKFWRKFLSKRSASSRRKKVWKSFATNELRQQAEEDWSEQLVKFFNSS